MTEKVYAAVCGICCGECQFLDQQCPGCGQVAGKPFWTSQALLGICPFYDCCRNQKNLEHCGVCDRFPCKVFSELRDPNMTDDEFEESLNMRKNNLLARKTIGTERWLRERTG